MVGVGYFWAINRSYDALARVQYFTQRGPAQTVDFRGKVKPGTDFNVSVYAVQDRGIRSAPTERSADHSEAGRRDGGIPGEESQLGDGWIAKGGSQLLLFLSLPAVVLRELPRSHLFRIALGRISDETLVHLSVITIVADRDEQFQSAAPDDKIIFARLPEVQFLSREHEISNTVLPVWFSLESSAGLLYRAEPDFQTRQFVDRVDVNPRITTALHWKGFSLVPSFLAARNAIRAKALRLTGVEQEFRTQLARDWRWTADLAVAGAHLQGAQMAGG